jgi:hypothetical protein
MAETKRLTAEQVFGYLFEGERLDFPKESLFLCLAAVDGGGGVGVDRRRSRGAGAEGAVHAPRWLLLASVVDVRGRARVVTLQVSHGNAECFRRLGLRERQPFHRRPHRAPPVVRGAPNTCSDAPP